MRYNGSHEVEDETDSSRYSEGRLPNSHYQPEGSGKFAGCQQREVSQRHPDSFVDYLHLKRIAPDLANAGIGRDKCEQQSNYEIGNAHLNIPLWAN